MYVTSMAKCEVVGHVGVDPVVRAAGEDEVASFRVAVPERRGDETGWYSVSAWGPLGAKVSEQVRKGNAVKVLGRLHVRVLPAKGEFPRREFFEIVATKVGVFVNEDEVKWLVPAGVDGA